MKFKVKNINLNIYYKYLSLLICDGVLVFLKN